MDGGELFSRIEESQGFSERGESSEKEIKVSHLQSSEFRERNKSFTPSNFKVQSSERNTMKILKVSHNCKIQNSSSNAK